MPTGVYVWSKTAGTNATADSSIQWQEGQAPSSVNDSARAMMARIAEARDDWGGTLLTSGTSTAYVVATSQSFASLALMNNQTITVVMHTTSGAAPTLAVDGLPAKPLRCILGVPLSAGTFTATVPYSFTYYDGIGEFVCRGAAIADGAISTINLAAQAVTAAKIANNTITGAQIAPGAVTAATVSPSFFPVNTTMLNGTITQTVAAGAITFAIKTLAGANPSAGDPTTFLFRDATIGTGDYLVRSVTAALSVTIGSAHSAGVLSTVPARIWLLAVDNAGTVELAVFNAAGLVAGTPVGVGNIFPLQGWGIITTQAVSVAASAGVAYSTAARSSVAYVPIGYAVWEAGNTMTAGTWTAPSRLQIFQPGSTPLPAQIVQQSYSNNGAFNSGSTAIPFDTTIPQVSEGNSYLSASITPSSSANALLIVAAGHFAAGSAGGRVTAALFQDANANALAATQMPAIGVNLMERLSIDFQMLASGSASTTFSLRAGNNAGATTFFNAEAAGSALYGGSLNSGLRVTEIMA